VKRWLTQESLGADGTGICPPVDTPLIPVPSAQDETQPPPPWHTGDEVRQVREGLKEHRFLLVRRPDHLTGDAETIVATLLASPVGSPLQVAHHFVQDWHAFWRDDRRLRN